MFNVTNYFDHPSRPGYTVFKFHEEERANYFEELLKEKSIWHESTKEDGAFLFGIRKSDYKTAVRLLQQVEKQDHEFLPLIIEPLIECYHQLQKPEALLKRILPSHLQIRIQFGYKTRPRLSTRT